MKHKPLPNFESPTTEVLREMYFLEHISKEQARILILELVRQRRLFNELDRLRMCVLAAWSEETGGSHQVGLHKMRLLLQDERKRAGDDD